MKMIDTYYPRKMIIVMCYNLNYAQLIALDL